MIDRPFHKGDPSHLILLTQSIRALPEGWYDVTITPKQRATQAARGYLHGVVMPIYAQMIGEFDKGAPWPDDEAWDRCKKQFRPREYVDPVTGEVQTVGRSTKGMTPRELFEFTQLIVDWIHDNGGACPAPDKRWREARERAMREQRSVA
jgi:hypothetical protein